MEIDFDRLKYSLTGEYEEVMLEKENKKLQDRIDKAIEYIEDRYHIKGTMTYDSPIYHKDLLEILKGEE